MPTIWIECPLIVHEGVSIPKVEIIINPVTGKGYTHSPVFVVGGGRALCIVTGATFAPILSDPECSEVFGPGSQYSQGANHLSNTPQGLGWTQGRVDQMIVKLAGRGADTTKLTNGSPLWEWLTEYGKTFRPDFPGPQGTWVPE